MSRGQQSPRGVLASRAQPHSPWAKVMAGKGRSPCRVLAVALKPLLPWGAAPPFQTMGTTAGPRLQRQGEGNEGPRPLLSSRRHPGANALGSPSWPRPLPTIAAPPGSWDKAQTPPEPHTKQSDPRPPASLGSAAPPAALQQGAAAKARPLPRAASLSLPVASS